MIISGRGRELYLRFLFSSRFNHFNFGSLVKLLASWALVIFAELAIFLLGPSSKHRWLSLEDRHSIWEAVRGGLLHGTDDRVEDHGAGLDWLWLGHLRAGPLVRMMLRWIGSGVLPLRHRCHFLQRHVIIHYLLGFDRHRRLLEIVTDQLIWYLWNVVLLFVDRAAQHKVLAASRTNNTAIPRNMSTRRASHRLCDRIVIAYSRLASSAFWAFATLELHLEPPDVAARIVVGRIGLLLKQLLAMVNVQVPLETLHSSAIVRLDRLILHLYVSRAGVGITQFSDVYDRIRSFLSRRWRLALFAIHFELHRLTIARRSYAIWQFVGVDATKTIVEHQGHWSSLRVNINGQDLLIWMFLLLCNHGLVIILRLVGAIILWRKLLWQHGWLLIDYRRCLALDVRLNNFALIYLSFVLWLGPWVLSKSVGARVQWIDFVVH